MVINQRGLPGASGNRWMFGKGGRISKIDTEDLDTVNRNVGFLGVYSFGLDSIGTEMAILTAEGIFIASSPPA